MLQNKLSSSPDVDAARTSGPYMVDISPDEQIGLMSSEWFSRRDDERYL